MKHFSHCVRWSYTLPVWLRTSTSRNLLFRRSLLQNLSTFSEGYVRTSGAATKHKHLQQELYFKKTSQARGSHKPEMRKRFLWNLNYCCPSRVRSVLKNKAESGLIKFWKVSQQNLLEV